MDSELVKALDAMCDDLEMRRLDDVLADPEPHVYEPDDALADPDEPEWMWD